MRENDYTGSPIEDDDELSQIEDELIGVYEVDLDVDSLAFDVDDNEMVISISGAAEGATTLRAAAELLYEFADELLAMAGEGWEIVEDITNGYGTAVRFGTDEPDETDLTDDV